MTTVRKIKYFTAESLAKANDEAIFTNRNRTLYQDKVRDLPLGTRFPVIFSMIHNDCEIRVSIAVGPDADNLTFVWLDVPFETFNTLPEIEVPAGETFEVAS